MVQYSFTTRFIIAASRDKVWDVLIKFNDWQTWWKGMKDVTLADLNAQKVNCRVGYWFYTLKIQLSINKIQKEKQILITSSGDLIGTGEFNLEKIGENTQVTFLWNVATTKPWMNVTAFATHHFFEYSHSKVMNQFAYGMAKKLNTKILEIEYK